MLDAALEAGGKRFRPIGLTSVTTFTGLTPLMMDRSLQAQFLIPMAVSLGFGVIFATAVTLFLVPCALLTAEDLGRAFSRFRDWYFWPFRTTELERLLQVSLQCVADNCFLVTLAKITKPSSRRLRRWRPRSIPCRKRRSTRPRSRQEVAGAILS